MARFDMTRKDELFDAIDNIFQQYYMGNKLELLEDLFEVMHWWV